MPRTTRRSSSHGEKLSLLGLWIKGDLAGLTCYTTRSRKKVFYPEAPPTKPPSPAQVIQRARFRTAQLAWKSLSPQEKQTLEDATNATSLCMTGQNLFISAALQHFDKAYHTVALQARFTLPPLPYIP